MIAFVVWGSRVKSNLVLPVAAAMLIIAASPAEPMLPSLLSSTTPFCAAVKLTMILVCDESSRPLSSAVLRREVVTVTVQSVLVAHTSFWRAVTATDVFTPAGTRIGKEDWTVTDAVCPELAAAAAAASMNCCVV
jgi:hypothetical protein